MMGSRNGLPKKCCTTLFFYLSLARIIVAINGQAIQTCASNLSPPSSETTRLNVTFDHCVQVAVQGASPPADYNLWYKQDNSNSPSALSIILSVPKESPGRWYGMGFNPVPNSMTGTAAIIFWMNPTTAEPKWGTYYLSNPSLSGVNPDSTRFNFTMGKSPEVISDTSSLYLAFQVNESTPANFAFQNFVLGQPGDVPTGDVISGQQQHQGESSVQINFAIG